MAENPQALEAMVGDRIALLQDPVLHERWQQRNSVHERLARLFEKGFDRGLKKTKRDLTDKIFKDLLEDVILRPQDTVDPAAWGRRIGKTLMRNIAREIYGVVKRSIEQGIRRQMPGPEFELFELQQAVPEDQLANFAREYTQNVVMYHSDTSRLGTSKLVQLALDRGVPTEGIGSLAWRALGVDPKWANAAMNYRKALLEAEEPMPRSLIERAWDRYVADATGARAELFAQTETMTAMNFGQQMIWEQAILNGDLPRDANKVWITAMDERVCPICEPLDKKAVPILTRFKTDAGKLWVPPAHPRCRCTVIPDIFLGGLGELHSRIMTSRRGKVPA